MELKEYVYEKLEHLNIPYQVVNHKALFSEQDTNLDDFEKDITMGKNLFLRNKKKDKYYLILILLTKRINLQELEDKLNEKRFSFANENELYEHLKITPGSVSYLNVITAEKLGGNFRNVLYVIDKEVINAEKIGFHPSDNTATVVTRPDSILKVFDEYNLKYYIIDI